MINDALGDMLYVRTTSLRGDWLYKTLYSLTSKYYPLPPESLHFTFYYSTAILLFFASRN